MPSSINLDNGNERFNIFLDAQGNLRFNANGIDGGGDTIVSINDENGIVTLGGSQGGVSRDGGLQLRNARNDFTIFIGGGETNILMGGGTDSSMFLGNAQGVTPISLFGNNGVIILGADPRGSAPGQDGNLLLRDGNGSISIVLTGSNGNCRCVSLTETSDLRLKKEIAPLLNALDKVLAMRGVRYQRKQDDSPKKAFDEGYQIGFVGQEMETVCPEIISTDAEGYKSLSYSRLTPILVEAIKEQQQLIQRQASALQEVLEKIARIETAMKEQSA